MTAASEASDAFSCFGSTCAVFVTGRGDRGDPRQAVAFARRRLLEWHTRFSRFDPDSELSGLNADRRQTVPVSWEMVRLAAAAGVAAERTGGLVDATLVDQIEAAGYTADLTTSLTLADALDRAPRRRPAAPNRKSRWHEISADREQRAVTRPPGVKLDSGGLAKGMLADLLAAALTTHASFAIDCAGDLRLGGTARMRRPVLVASPFDRRTLHEFSLAGGGIATSGIGRRSWLDASGAPAHHLLDPATGQPAYTGVVQVTALAATALEAEIRTKAAILGGPAGARDWLTDGGVIVYDDQTSEIVPPRGRASRPAASQGSGGNFRSSSAIRGRGRARTG